jgi:hypothetical protein
MGIALAFNAKFYRAVAALADALSATVAAATWVEVKGVHDVKVPLEFTEGDITTRKGGGFELTAATLTKAQIEFDMPLDITDADYIALETAAIAKTPLAMAFMSGDITVTGNRGLAGNFIVTKMERDESAANPQRMNFAVKPYSFPSWYIK